MNKVFKKNEPRGSFFYNRRLLATSGASGLGRIGIGPIDGPVRDTLLRLEWRIHRHSTTAPDTRASLAAVKLESEAELDGGGRMEAPWAAEGERHLRGFPTLPFW
jgi:hypothetical protein